MNMEERFLTRFRKHRKVTILVFVILLCWGIMAYVDYSLCKKVEPPIFAIEMPVNDQSQYIGLGYTIVLRYNGPIGMSGEQLKGYFYWGWRK